MKKFLCLLLILGTMLFLSACKPSGIKDDISWDIKDGVLTINGEGAIGNFCTDWNGTYFETTCYDPSTIPWYGLDYHTVILEEGITTVSKHAFADAENLKKVIIRGQNIEIDYCAFYNCKNLQEIENSEQITFMDIAAFGDCVQLKSIKLGSKLRALYDFIQYALSGCTALESVEIHKDHKELESVDGVVYTSGMKELLFYPMGKQDQSFVIPDAVDTIDSSAFKQVQHLESVTIAGCNANNYAFENCPALNTVIVGNGVNMTNSVFSNCSALESFQVTADNSTYSTRDGVLYKDSGEYLLISCYPSEKKDLSFTVPEDVSYIQANAFKDCKYLENVDFAGSRITCISGEAFYSCKSLKSITLPESVTEIGQNAFAECDSLKNITLPEGLTTLGKEAFRHCDSLESIRIPGGVTELYGTFWACKGLKTVEIAEGVTSIHSEAFRSCDALETVIIPKSVTNITPYALDGVQNLTICCYKNSAAEEYAKTHNIAYILYD